MLKGCVVNFQAEQTILSFSWTDVNMQLRSCVIWAEKAFSSLPMFCKVVARELLYNLAGNRKAQKCRFQPKTQMYAIPYSLKQTCVYQSFYGICLFRQKSVASRQNPGLSINVFRVRTRMFSWQPWSVTTASLLYYLERFPFFWTALSLKNISFRNAFYRRRHFGFSWEQTLWSKWSTHQLNIIRIR